MSWQGTSNDRVKNHVQASSQLNKQRPLTQYCLHPRESETTRLAIETTQHQIQTTELINKEGTTSNGCKETT